MTPLGVYAGYLLLRSGNVWLALCFLVVTGLCFLVVLLMICRYIINYRRNKHPLAYEVKSDTSQATVIYK